MLAEKAQAHLVTLITAAFHSVPVWGRLPEQLYLLEHLMDVSHQ